MDRDDRGLQLSQLRRLYTRGAPGIDDVVAAADYLAGLLERLGAALPPTAWPTRWCRSLPTSHRCCASR